MPTGRKQKWVQRRAAREVTEPSSAPQPLRNLKIGVGIEMQEGREREEKEQAGNRRQEGDQADRQPIRALELESPMWRTREKFLRPFG